MSDDIRVEIATGWSDYELLDAGDGEKLERWGKYILRRPDPVAVWPKSKETKEWTKPHATYLRNDRGGGQWQYHLDLPDSWHICRGQLKFRIKPTPFKHTGLFPEQAVNWDWINRKLQSANHALSVLNLFAYTGAATLAVASAGASVCHVDSSKGVVTWARNNLELSGLAERPVRWIVEDARKFLEREFRRGRRYDAVIMDPPSYGRGAGGEVWKFEDQISDLMRMVKAVLSSKPEFVLVNSYTAGYSSLIWKALFHSIGFGGTIQHLELGLRCSRTGHLLPCGVSARWTP